MTKDKTVIVRSVNAINGRRTKQDVRRAARAYVRLRRAQKNNYLRRIVNKLRNKRHLESV